MTLRKGEFWSCTKCTLKNPLTSPLCKVCKTEKNSLNMPVVSRSPSPRHGGSKKHNNGAKIAHAKMNYLQKSSSKIKDRSSTNSDIDQGKSINLFSTKGTHWAVRTLNYNPSLYLRNRGTPSKRKLLISLRAVTKKILKEQILLNITFLWMTLANLPPLCLHLLFVYLTNIFIMNVAHFVWKILGKVEKAQSSIRRLPFYYLCCSYYVGYIKYFWSV